MTASSFELAYLSGLGLGAEPRVIIGLPSAAEMLSEMENAIEFLLQKLDQYPDLAAQNRAYLNDLNRQVRQAGANLRQFPDTAPTDVKGLWEFHTPKLQVIGQAVQNRESRTLPSRPVYSAPGMPSEPEAPVGIFQSIADAFDSVVGPAPEMPTYGTVPSLSTGGAISQLSVNKYKSEVLSSGSPASNMTTPAPDREPSWFNLDQIKALVGTIAEGYSTVEKSKLAGQLVAQQQQGKPIQVPSQVKLVVQKAAFPWAWVVVGALGVTALVVLVSRPRKSTAPATASPATAATVAAPA